MSSLSPTTLAPAASPLASIAEPWRVLEDSRPPTLAMLASATSRLAENAHDLAAMLTIIRLATSTGDLRLAKRYATAAIADCEGRNDLQSLSAVSCFITRSVDPDWGLNLVLKKCIAGGRFEMGNPCYEEALKAVGLQSLLRDLMQSGAAAGKMYNVNGFSGIDVEQQQANRAKGYGYAFLNTMPKSGSVFLADHLASLYRTPFARIGVDSFPRSLVIPGRAEVLAQGGLSDQMHLDASPENLDQLERAGIRKIYLHVRDPRQATLSWAHHLESADMTGGNAFYRAALWKQLPSGYDALPWRRKLDWNVQYSYPAFARWAQEWLDAMATQSHRFDIRVSEFAAFAADPTAAVNDLLAFFDIPDRFDRTTSVSGMSHYRKGRADEWREVFSPAQLEAMAGLITPQMRETFGWA